MKPSHCFEKSAKNNITLFAAFIDCSPGFGAAGQDQLGIKQHEVKEDSSLLMLKRACFQVPHRQRPQEQAPERGNVCSCNTGQRVGAGL